MDPFSDDLNSRPYSDLAPEGNDPFGDVDPFDEPKEVAKAPKKEDKSLKVAKAGNLKIASPQKVASTPAAKTPQVDLTTEVEDPFAGEPAEIVQPEEDQGVSEWVGQRIRSVGSGLGGSLWRAVENIPRAVSTYNPLSIASRAFNDEDNDIADWIDNVANKISSFASDVADITPEAYGVDQETRETFTGQLAEGAGQLIGQIGTSLLSPALGMTNMFGQMYGEAISDAEQTYGKKYEDFNEAERSKASTLGLVYGSVGGALERIGLGTIFGPLAKKGAQITADDVVTQITKGAIGKRIIKGMFGEGLTETAQGQLLDNLAQLLIDPTRNVNPLSEENFKSRLTEFALGAILGGGAAPISLAVESTLQDATVTAEADRQLTSMMGSDYANAEPEVKKELVNEHKKKVVDQFVAKKQREAAEAEEKLETSNPVNDPDLQPRIEGDEETQGDLRTQRGDQPRTPGTIRIKHFGRVPGLPALDPSFHGSGIAGTEKQTKLEYSKIYKDRTYFGTEDYVREPNLPDNEYSLEVEPELLYDPAEDPDGIYAEVRRKIRAGETEYAPLDKRAGDLLAQQAVVDAGYVGIVNTAANAGAIFVRVPTNQPITKEWYEASKKLSKNPQKLSKNFEAAIEKVRDTPREKEGGITLNADGTAYEGEGIVVGVNSLNKTLASIRPSDMLAMLDAHATLLQDPNVKIRLYNPEANRDVSLDISIVVPAENKAAALEFAKLAGQESIYDIKTGKLTYTGADVKNPKSFSIQEYEQIKNDLKEGKVPSVVQQRRTIRGEFSDTSTENNPSRVGTALQKNKGGVTTQDTNVDISLVDPAALKKQMAKLTHFIKNPDFKLPKYITRFRNPEKRKEALLDFMTGNILALHDSYPQELRVRASRWYDGARWIADDISSKTSATPEQAAGVIAAFSPMKDWFQNVQMAKNLIDIYDNNFSEKLSTTEHAGVIDGLVEMAANEHKDDRRAMLSSIIGKSAKELWDSGDQIGASWVVRLLSVHKHGTDFNVIAPEGYDVAVKTRKDGANATMVWQSSKFITKAIDMMEDGSLDNISNLLGEKHKIRNFYNNIIAPNSDYGDATIDTHAVGAAFLFPMGNKGFQVDQAFGGGGVAGGGMVGTYWLSLEAYRRAAAARGIQPRQMQSITWEAVRELFTDNDRRNPKFVANINTKWTGTDNVEKARESITEGQQYNPSWAESDPAGRGYLSRPNSVVGSKGGAQTQPDGSVESGTVSRTIRGDNRGNPETKRVAQQYMDQAGLARQLTVEYVIPDVDYLMDMADFLEKAPDDLDAPGVRESYEALARETMAQYDVMVANGIEVEPYDGDGEPYASSAEMEADVRDNKHMWFLLTEGAFGSDGEAKTDHPLLQKTGITINGKDLVYNDIFRAVHDYFGHTKGDFQFGPRGEYNAFLAHAQMFTDAAVPALAAETLAQNAWVNYGKHIRRKDKSIPKKGDKDYIDPADRPFADQKTFIVPPDRLPGPEKRTIRGADQTKTPEFKRWFGDSKVVDENGEPLVVYHGSDKLSFDVFNTDGEGKTEGTGAFFSDTFSMAATYTSDNDVKSPPPSEAEFIADPEAYDYTVTFNEQYEEWTVFDSQGKEIATEQGREDALISAHYELTRDDRPGVYAAYISMQDPMTIDANGQNWDEISDSWDLIDEDGEIYDSAYTEELAKAAVESGQAVEYRQGFGQSTDQWAREARDGGYDGLIIKNVSDEGKYGRGYNIGDVYIAFRPEQIKSSTDNRGTFDPADPRITRTVRPAEPAPAQSPLAAGLDTPADAHQRVNNIIKASRISGVEAKIRNPDTNNPDPSFQGVGGTYDVSQRVINVAIGETVGVQDMIAVAHEVIHDIYNTAPQNVQDALVRWLKKMENGDLKAFTDPRSTDPRIRPNNPYNLSEPTFNEEAIVESLAIEGIDAPIATGIVADIIRILKDLYYRAAMVSQEAWGVTSPNTAKLWANNRVQAMMAGQSYHLDLASLVGARKMTTLFKNQSLYTTEGKMAYRLRGGVLTLPAVLTPNADGTKADMAAIEENANQELLMSRLGSQARGEAAIQQLEEHVDQRLSALDVEYARAFNEDDQEVMSELVAEAADLLGFTNEGYSLGGAKAFSPPFQRFVDFSGSDPLSKEYGNVQPVALRMENTLDLSKGLEGAPDPTDRIAFRKYLDDGGFDSAIVPSQWGGVDYIVVSPDQLFSLNPTEYTDAGQPISLRERFSTNAETRQTVRVGSLADQMTDRVGEIDGIDYLFEDYEEGEVELSNIDATPQGQGLGTEAMNRITAASDELGVDLMLIPAERNAERLGNFYERFGFEWDGEVMRRPSSKQYSTIRGTTRFTERSVSEKAMTAKRNAMNRIWSSARQGIAVHNELTALVDRVANQFPDLTREEVLKIIGFRKDPILEKQEIMAAFAQRKQAILPEFEGEVDSDIVYDDLKTEAEQTGYKLIAQHAAFSIPAKIASKLAKNTKAREKGERILEKNEERYESIITQLNDVKELEAEVRKSIQVEFRQLVKDIQRNSRADVAFGEAAQLLRSLMPELNVSVYPKQFEQMLRKINVDDTTPLFLINKELMSLDLDWENTPIKELYGQALQAIRNEIKADENTPLSLLLSGPAFERGDATLKSLAENDQLAKLRGSALLATMITFVKKNKVQAQALALAQETADEKATIMAELQAISGTYVQEDLAALKEQIKNRPSSALRDRLVAQMALLRSKVIRARNDIQRDKNQSEVLQAAHGSAKKFFDQTSAKLGLQENWNLYEGAEIPTEIDYNASPEDVLSGKGSKIINLELNQSKLPAKERAELTMQLMKRGQEIQQYLIANPQYADTYAYKQLEVRAQLLLDNVIASDKIIATSSLRDVLRSSGDRVAQSGTVGGRWFAQATRQFDRIKQSYKKFMFDGNRLSGLRKETLKASGIKSDDLLSKMYDAGIAYLEGERVLTGKAALDNMVDTLRLNPTFAQGLQTDAARNKFQEWVQASIDMGRRAVEISADEGNLVKDTVGGQTIYRDHLNRGVGMIPRSLNAWVYTLMNEFAAANPAPFDPDNSPFVRKDGESIEEFSARVKSAIASVGEFQEEIISPIILNDRVDLFPQPNNDGVRLDAWTIRQAWDKSGNDVVETARILAEDYGADAEVYVDQFVESLNTMLVKLNKMATESNARDEAGNYGPILTQSKFGSEARVGSDVPSEMTSYTQFSESQNDVILTRIAGEAAFGRDYEGIVRNANLVEAEMRDKANIFERAKNKHSVNGKMDKKAVKKELGSRYKELAAAYEARSSGAYKAKSIVSRFDGVLNSRELSADIGWFEETHSAIISAMLQGWRTAMKQLSQIYSTTASMRAISRFNAFDPFSNLFNTAKAFANWPFRLLGYEPFTVQYGDLIKQANLGELEQQVRIGDSMGDIGVNAEMARDGVSRFKQKTRGIRNLINRVSIGKKGEFLFPGPTPFLFRPVNQISLTIGTNRVLGWMEKMAQFGDTYLKQNPDKTLADLRIMTAEDLGFKDRLFWFDDASFWNNFLTLLNSNGLTLDQLVGRYQSNKTKGLDGLDVSHVQTAQVMTKEVFSVESMLSTAPAFSKSSPVGRMSWSLMNWSTRTGAVNFIDTVVGRDILGRKQEGYKQLQSSIAGSKALMFSLLPAALLFSLYFDWFDEEVAGKKSNVRPLLKPNNLPEFSLSVLERIGDTGPFGIVGDLGNGIANIGTGKPALSFDERVVWASTLLGMQNLLSTAISVETYKNPSGLTYNQFMRPLAQSLGLGSVLSNVQVVNNVLGLDNVESRTATRINTQNALRGAGRTIGLEVRSFGAGGYARAVPYTPHVTNMILAAMSNSGEQFNESYQEAVRAMMDFKNVPIGEAKDRVKRSYAQRHPIKTVFKTTPTASEYRQLLSSMSPGLRRDVQKSLASFNRWGETIGVKPYFGKQASKKKKSLALQEDMPSLEDEILRNIQARYAL